MNVLQALLVVMAVVATVVVIVLLSTGQIGLMPVARCRRCRHCVVGKEEAEVLSQHSETAPNFDDYQYKMYGFGSTPQAYQWNDLPRDILGEGIVLSVGSNSSTVLITTSRFQMYAGDYVEIE